MLGTIELILLLLCSSILTCMFLCSAIVHLFKLGKSKAALKKDRQNTIWYRRLFFIGYADKCKFHASKARKICYIFWAYLSMVAICLFISGLSIPFVALKKILFALVFVKLLILDMPIWLYSFVMTKHDKKNGGVTWRWTKFNQRKNK